MAQNKPPIGAEITANVGRILDEAKVPYTLMGRQAMFFYADPTVYGVSIAPFPADVLLLPLLTVFFFSTRT
jgi:hypothetical protein